MTQQLNLRVFGEHKTAPKIVPIHRTQNLLAMQAVLRIVAAAARVARRDVRAGLHHENVAELNKVARHLERLMAVARGTSKFRTGGAS